MKYLRGIVSWCLCYLMTVTVMASALDAHGVMNRVSEAFRKAGGIEATFTLQMGTASQLVKGSICLLGDKFVLDAAGVKTWFDGRTQWSYLLSTEEVNVSLPTPEELQTLHPFAWLSLSQKGYKMHLECESAKAYYIVLSSMTPYQVLQRIWIEIDKQTYYPLSVRIQQVGDSQDGILSIKIIDLKTQQAYSDSFFVFDSKKYPDAEIIDLR